jgi:AbrB family looped-hinge helix DNA binding protein
MEGVIAMATNLTKKGQVTIPKLVRDYLGIHAGDPIEFRILDEQVIVEKAIMPSKKITFGTMKGMIKIADDFDDPLECFEEYMP